MANNIDIAKELGLNKDYTSFKLGDKHYIMRKPTAMEAIELEDRNAELDGKVDIYGYISDILKFVSPQISINDVIKQKDSVIVVGEHTLHFNKVTIEQGFKTILSTSKIGTNSDGEKVMKLNRHETIKKIIELAHKEDESITLDCFKTKDELNEILEKFQALFDIEQAMEVYNTFQSIE